MMFPSIFDLLGKQILSPESLQSQFRMTSSAAVTRDKISVTHFGNFNSSSRGRITPLMAASRIALMPELRSSMMSENA